MSDCRFNGKKEKRSDSPERNVMRGHGHGRRIRILTMGLLLMTFLSAQAYRITHPANTCCANLKQLDQAKATWCLERKYDPGEKPGFLLSDNELIGPLNYIRDMPSCMMGGSYNFGDPLALTECSLHGTTENFKMDARPPGAARRQTMCFGLVILSATGFLLVRLILPFGLGLPENIRQILKASCPLGMVAVTLVVAISRDRWENDNIVLRLPYWFTLLFSGWALFLKPRSARVVGWIVISFFLAIGCLVLYFDK